MKALKWIAIVIGGLIVLVIVALLLIPMFVDIEDYKPQIEQMVAESTGRPFRLGGDLSLSLFPWAGVALSDVHLGNPSGFEEKDFVSVKSFEVRVKLLPLLSKQVEIKKFVLDRPRVLLIKGKDGEGNWQGLGKPSASPVEQPKGPVEGKSLRLPIRSLVVGEFLVSNGSVLWIDRTTGMKKEIQNFRLELENVSLEKPIQVALSAILDGRPVSLTGTVGPVGKEPGKGTMPIDLKLAAFEEMNVEVEGTIQDAASDPTFDLGLVVSPFSPRKLMAALKQPFPVATSDPKVLDAVVLNAKIKGNARSVSITDGAMELDDSKITFSLNAKEFDRPNLAFDLNMDTIDLDRYLPSSGEKKPAGDEKAQPSQRKKTDYAPLRGVILDGKIRIGDLKVKGVKAQNLEMKISGRNGLFQMDPLSLNMYKGSVAGKGTLDVRTDIPKHVASLDAKGIQVNPLLQDMLQKDFLEGKFLADLEIALQGDDAQKMKQTLSGGGELVFTDGAIKGINLTDMAQNVKSAFGAAEAETQKARTDFSELRVPFTASNGVVQTQGTTMVTPLMRLAATGKADLVQETMDFRVEPKAVATLKGKGDAKERIGIMVPVVVSGSFASPKFRPDVKGIAKEKLREKMEGVLKGKEGEEVAPSGDTVKDLIKKLPFGK
jgi:AsmA protein